MKKNFLKKITIIAKIRFSNHCLKNISTAHHYTCKIYVCFITLYHVSDEPNGHRICYCHIWCFQN